jgi:hypothetical protein
LAALRQTDLDILCLRALQRGRREMASAMAVATRPRAPPAHCAAARGGARRRRAAPPPPPRPARRLAGTELATCASAAAAAAAPTPPEPAGQAPPPPGAVAALARALAAAARGAAAYATETLGLLRQLHAPPPREVARRAALAFLAVAVFIAVVCGFDAGFAALTGRAYARARGAPA